FETLRLGAQTVDGMYSFEMRAKNVANNNQSYVFDWSKAGEHYGTLSWDQIPHLYSRSAQSIWNPSSVGSNFLTTSLLCSSTVNATVGTCLITNLPKVLNTIDIGIERDKFTAMHRWTPSQNWDVRGDYSWERREGTQIGSAYIGGTNGGVGAPLTGVGQL